MSFDPQDYISRLSGMSDDQIDLGLAALALAAAQQSGISVERYVHHLKKLCEDVAQRHVELLSGGAKDDVETQLAALKHTLSDKYAYTGDRETYNDIQNASLIRVIDRAKGLPVALSILYICAGVAQGWHVVGLDVPGHFVCRIEKNGRRLIFDPFEDCKTLEAPDLRLLVKTAVGSHAELSSEYFNPASNREILLRLQNNIKFRQIEIEDYKGALEVVKLMRLVDPYEYRLLLDEGVLYAKVDETKSAIEALEGYIKLAPNNRDRQQAAMLLLELKQSLN
jgi:regulator of sirC expression with transglutaminase-like and TPR domain